MEEIEMKMRGREKDGGLESGIGHRRLLSAPREQNSDVMATTADLLSVHLLGPASASASSYEIYGSL
jgi:hypothetical protein